jgi:CRISPR/Cas system-associated exonuclease Cas4 (RecB family)
MNTYWKKNFSWSKSRQGLLEDCPLAYYFTYIARFEPGQEASAIAPLLKLKKFHFFKGNLLHDAVRNQITQSRLARNMSLEAAKNFVSLEFEKIFSNQAQYISESYNGLPLDKSIVEAEKQDCLIQLTNFFTVIWHNYKNLEILTHERLESFMLDTFKIWVQPDLVSKTRQGLVISDWKTGSADWVDADTDLQLSVYILWASKYYSVNTNNIAAELVYLKTTQSLPTKRTNEQIEWVKQYILQQANKMLEAKDKTEFIPKPRFNLCKGCNFSTICTASAINKGQIEVNHEEYAKNHPQG